MSFVSDVNLVVVLLLCSGLTFTGLVLLSFRTTMIHIVINAHERTITGRQLFTSDVEIL